MKFQYKGKGVHAKRAQKQMRQYEQILQQAIFGSCSDGPTNVPTKKTGKQKKK